MTDTHRKVERYCAKAEFATKAWPPGLDGIARLQKALLDINKVGKNTKVHKIKVVNKSMVEDCLMAFKVKT